MYTTLWLYYQYAFRYDHAWVSTREVKKGSIWIVLLAWQGRGVGGAAIWMVGLGGWVCSDGTEKSTAVLCAWCLAFFFTVSICRVWGALARASFYFSTMFKFLFVCLVPIKVLVMYVVAVIGMTATANGVGRYHRYLLPLFFVIG